MRNDNRIDGMGYNNRISCLWLERYRLNGNRLKSLHISGKRINSQRLNCKRIRSLALYNASL